MAGYVFSQSVCLETPHSQLLHHDGEGGVHVRVQSAGAFVFSLIFNGFIYFIFISVVLDDEK